MHLLSIVHLLLFFDLPVQEEPFPVYPMLQEQV